MRVHSVERVGELLDFLGGSDFESFRGLRSSLGPFATEANNFHNIWFRGQSDKSWNLEPGAFRCKGNYDEGSATWHFMLTATAERGRCSTDFEWLCLMQHYGLPTRLLDWSESALVGLFFACEEKLYHSSDGCLYILNAERLNFYNPKRRRSAAVLTPANASVALRALMARSADANEFMSELNGFARASVIDPVVIEHTLVDGNLDDLDTPIAVFPFRSYPRMVVQHSVFTIHGGKAPQSAMSPGNKGLLPAPIPLSVLNGLFLDAGRFLIKLVIPADRKIHLLKELKLLGSTRASLFPELEHQAAFLKSLWTKNR